MKRLAFVAILLTLVCLGASTAYSAMRVEVINLPCGGFIVTELDDGGCIFRQWGEDCFGNRWIHDYSIKPRSNDLGLYYNMMYDGYIGSSYYYCKFVYNTTTGVVGQVWGMKANGEYYEAVVE